MKNTTDGRVTELEGVVLALIHRGAPMTAYEVKKQLAASPSRFWSGSAGAIYPLIKRLVARGLLSSRDSSTGRRPSKIHHLTKLGIAHLEAWICDVDRAIDPGIDPLRMRLLFLSMMSADRRATFLDAVTPRLEEALEARPFEAGNASVDNDLHKVWMRARLKAFRETCRRLFG